MNKNKNSKLLWATSFIIIFIFWILFGSTLINLFSQIVYYFDKDNTFFNTTLFKYIAINIPFLCIILATYYCLKYINKKNFKYLINNSLIIDYKLLINTLILSISYFIIVTILGRFLNLYSFSYNQMQLTSRILFILLALVITPIQVIAEEVLFRSFLILSIFNKYQELKDSNNKKLYTILFSVLLGLLFILPHLFNPEVNSSFLPSILYYFTFGTLASLSIFITNGLEISIAIHLANNLLIALFFNYKNSALPSLSLFIKENENIFSKYYDTISLVLLFIIIAIINKNKINDYFINKKRELNG